MKNEQTPLVGEAVPQGAAPPSLAQDGYPVSALPQSTQWTTGLCNCMSDVAGCCENYWCFPCQAGRQYKMIRTNQEGLDPVVCCATMMCKHLAAVYMRNRLREKYGIAGTPCEDLLIGWCCAPCSMCQTYREMSVRGQWPGGVCVSRPFYLRMHTGMM